MLNGKPIAIDLFCGAGGLSEGLQMAGFKVSLAVDICDYSAQTYIYNHPNTSFIKADLSAANLTHLLRKRLGKGEVDLVAGGPPCQGFSNANRKTNGSNNPLNKLVYNFINAVEEIKPKSFLMENVPGILAVDGGEFASGIISQFEKLGYYTSAFNLNTASFGVPQIRERVFFVGCVTEKIAIPKARRKKPITVRDSIIGDLPPINHNKKWRTYEYVSEPLSAYQKYVRSSSKKVFNHIASQSSEEVRFRNALIPKGGNWKDLPSEYLKKLRVSHSYMYRRLDPEKPSITIANIGKSMLIHPTQNRGLSIREVARLQSFKDNYLFFGSITSMQRQVGNAVPPLLGNAVARQIYKLVHN